MNKIKLLYQQYGLGVFNRLIKSVLLKFGIINETLILFEKQIEKNDIEHRLGNLDISNVKVLQIEDFDLCDLITDQKKQLYKSRFLSGNYTALGIFKNKKLVYYSWISWKEIGYPFGFEKMQLKSHEALLEDSFCHPEHRGRGFHGKVNIVRLKTILDKGKKNALVLVVNGNRPAIKVQLKSGFTQTKTIVLRRILGKSEIIIKDLK